jgi:hypothetical protein
MWSIRSGYWTVLICSTFTCYYVCLPLIKNVIVWQYFVKFSDNNNIHEICLFRVVMCVQTEGRSGFERTRTRPPVRVSVLCRNYETFLHLYVPIDMICMYLLTSSVYTYWHHLYVPIDIICMYLFTSPVCTYWHHLYVPIDIICMYLLTSSVCTYWHHLFVPIDIFCMYLLTSSVCTYWHYLSLDPLYHSLRQDSFLLIFSHYKIIPSFQYCLLPSRYSWNSYWTL